MAAPTGGPDDATPVAADQGGAISRGRLGRSGESAPNPGSRPDGIIEWLIDWSLLHRPAVLVAALLLVAGGVLAYRSLPRAAFPDVTPIMVQVVTEAEGLAPEEVEDLITFPVETGVAGLENVEEVKSVSAFGVSVVNVYFADGTDLYFARQLVTQRLQEVQEEVPTDYAPILAPPTTGLGQIYQYELRGPGRSLMELRTLQDWVVRPALRTVPGVADVLSWGGEVQQFQARVRPELLRQHGLSLEEVAAAIEAGNENAGGSFVVENEEERLVRGIGRIETVAELGSVVVARRGGTPIRVADVADVRLGPEIRRGLVTRDGEGEAVVGIVLRLVGENTSRVIDAVEERVASIQEALPEGVTIVPFYDRAELVGSAVATVRNALLIGAALVVLVLAAFLGEVRSAFIVTLMLPLCAFVAFLLMRWLGFTADLMTLGGLAVAIGMLVDGAIVMVENVHRVLMETQEEDRRLDVVRAAAREVGRPIAFAVGIVIAVFLPLFTLQGVEGKMFSPMAFAIAFALTGSLLLSLTVIPVLCSFLLRASDRGATPVTRIARRLYRPVLEVALRWRLPVVVGAVTCLAASLFLIPLLGTEFIPSLDEGSLVVRVTMAPSISLDGAEEVGRRVEEELGIYPEVSTVVSFVGRAERSGEPEPVSNAEIYVGLRPEDSWGTGRTKDALVEAMRERLERIPGILVSFSQPIQIRQDELISGVRAELAIRLFGEDLDTLAARGEEIAEVVGSIPGAVDVVPEQVTGKPQLQVRVDRAALARHGLSVTEVQEVIRRAVGGESVGQVFEGRRRFDLFVRLSPESRSDATAIGRLLLDAPDERRVRMDEVADLRLASGPPDIRHDQGLRRLVVQAGVEGRDMGSFVAEGRRRLDEEVSLPSGYRVEWGGQFELQRRAMQRLSVVVPIVLFVVLALLYGAFGSARPALLVVLNVPFALIGGIVSLWISGQYLSVPAAVGFIALFGVAVLNGVVLVSYIVQRREAGWGIREAILEGSELRLRPVLMTALTTLFGLAPLLFARGVGSEVQRPLATVVVGGLISSTVLTLVLLPALYPWFDAVGKGVAEVGPEEEP